jgi:hypothetical protein
MPGLRILGQHPPGGAAADLYVSPAAGKGTVVSTLALVSATGALGTVRVRVVPSGAVEAERHTLIPVTTVPPGELVPVTIGVTLAPGDKLTALCTGGASVHAYGTEV